MADFTLAMAVPPASLVRAVASSKVRRTTPCARWSQRAVARNLPLSCTASLVVNRGVPPQVVGAPVEDLLGDLGLAAWRRWSPARRSGRGGREEEEWR